MDPVQARHALATGRVVATLTVPPGFLADLRSGLHAPSLVYETTRGGISSRVTQQVQALVYALNLRLQRAYVRTDLGYVQLIVRGGRATFAGQTYNVLGLARMGKLVWAKVALAAVVALALGLVIALVFGAIVEAGNVVGGEPWARLPLLALGLAVAGAALGALGSLLGALARDARSASLVAVLV